MGSSFSCDSCSHCTYDEDYEDYMCDIDLEEDDMQRFLASSGKLCPYYRLDNEYDIVKKQM